MTIYQLQTIYVSLGLFVELIGFGMTIYALRLARTHQQMTLAAWLTPMAIGQVLTIAYSLWTLFFRWMGMRTTPASTLTALILDAVIGLIGVYAMVRLVMFVQSYCREAKSTYGAA